MGAGGGARIGRGRGARRWSPAAAALALAVPALALAQQVPSGGPVGATPAVSAPLAGSPAAIVPGEALPGATLPGVVLPTTGLFGAGAATGLTLPPAQYTDYGASLGLGETDNVNLSSTHAKPQTLSAANLFFDLIRTGSRLELTALGNFSDIDYLEHAYGNQVLGRFDGLANLSLWSHHLTWLVRDDSGDEEIDPLESMTPNNLQRVNVLSTGPDLRLEPTLTSFIDLQALYSRSDYQNSPFDGDFGTESFTLGHELSELSSVSLIASVQQMTFNETRLNPDYQLRDYYGDYSIRGARTAIDLQLGLAQTNDSGSWQSTPRLQLSLTRNVSPFATVTLAGGREYMNGTAAFSSLTSGAAGGIAVGAAQQTLANALETFASAGWQFHRLRTTIGLTGGWQRNQYDRQSHDNYTSADAQLSLQRQLTPLLSADLIGTAYRDDYSHEGFASTYGTLGAGFVYRPGAWVVIYGQYAHQLSQTSGDARRTQGYGEDRVFLMIGYYPHSSGTAPPGGGAPGMPGF